MFLVKTKLAPSPIHGIGVFTLQAIPRGAPVYQRRIGVRYVRTFDSSVIHFRDESEQKFILHYGYLVPGSNLLRVDMDDVRFLNDAVVPGTATLAQQRLLEGECFIATRDIAAGEELTQDYLDFADPTWLAEKRAHYGEDS